MIGKKTIFTRIIVLIVLLLTPVLILYSYSNKVSVDVVKNELQSSSLNQLSFFLRQFDSTVEQLSMFPVILGADPYIRDFVDHGQGTGYDALKEQPRIAERIGLQSVSSAWMNELTLYLPKENRVVSTNIFKSYRKDDVALYAPIPGWSYVPQQLSPEVEVSSANSAKTAGQPVHMQFIRQIVEPVGATDPRNITAMIQVGFPSENISTMLDQVKAGGKGDPFFYKPGVEPITNNSSATDMLAELLPILSKQQLGAIGNRVAELKGRQFYVNYVKSSQLDWYLVDYVPVQNILAPITKTSILFYTTLALLLAMSMLAAYLLYRHVQYPIRRLMHGVTMLGQGVFSARVKNKANNEFDYLFDKFNEMAAQIQELVERVYAEKLRLREATLKQLQAQINPHFLYNSLFYVINTAMLGDTEAVVAMAQNLAEYYRYTTRIEDQAAPLKDELKLVDNYLTIQNLRMHRLEYEIDVPETMLGMRIPRLLLQPIVENAIVHGIEKKPGEGLIRIYGVENGERIELVVEDNGAGMTEEALRELERRLEAPLNGEIGFGVWNVHQRLQYMFGEGAGLIIAHSAAGGMKVTLRWTRSKEGGGPNDEPTADRG
ncbi:sensor histidine kinase [Paenibacillus thalictri]|uniref:Sensor histidine kinase n=1 Tax=Paenibacillus thalictri TaxID=2527873 RepID=A0A4Q9DGM4_9BACL|nr:sensor histidine kinase [Paenibacillus thalictri]TBL70389.1 sensor histidine kinase [Paenibacillus thalictri]